MCISGGNEQRGTLTNKQALLIDKHTNNESVNVWGYLVELLVIHLR
jgi:hypothetical protein